MAAAAERQVRVGCVLVYVVVMQCYCSVNSSAYLLCCSGQRLHARCSWQETCCAVQVLRLQSDAVPLHAHGVHVLGAAA
jgi:hypothetical protein